jgi:hypothetical protein
MVQKILIFSIFILIFTECKKQDHFITDDNYRNQVFTDFDKTKELAKNRSESLFSVFDKNLSLKEEEALKFLYAYMPLNDLADYNADFFLDNVRLAFEAQTNFVWGKDIPEDIFRHYVLPYRVNNENLDTARSVFYKELKERLKGLTLQQAALEVNHWCHEKVIYQPTDDRTISPLNAVKSAYGRCGEQSTFTVTALRAVCIPARQCYTPRWAHVDDNHAWVEVWIDGKWHYLGACEPEAKLDVAWFSEPVLRAMLVHSKVIGQYRGNENVDMQFSKYAYMNLLANYAPTKDVYVKVLDKKGNIVSGAEVEYQLYNYAEFYPLSKQKTNKEGMCKFATGFGDLMIWASKGNNFAYQKITVETIDTLTIVLGNQPALPYTEKMVLVPPVKREIKVEMSDDEKALNSACMLKEDSIRNNYVKSLISQAESDKLAEKLNLDKSKVWEYLSMSRGNYPEILKYFEQAVKIRPDYAVKQLEIVSKKDIRDVSSDILIGNLRKSSEFLSKFEDKEIFDTYVLNPRVANEKLTDSKTYLSEQFKKQGISTVEKLIEWIKKEVFIDTENNYYTIPLTPQGTFELKVSDGFSRDIFFVLACRSMGTAARLEPGTNLPQYYTDKTWKDAVLKETKSELQREKGTIVLEKSKTLKIDPLYHIHFSLAWFENGKYNTLDYEWEKPLSKMGNTFSVDTGRYMLITGNRQADGSVLAQLSFFNVVANKTTNVILELNEQAQKLNSIAKYDQIIGFKDTKGMDFQIATQKPYVLAWLDANMEPSKHALNDIQQINKELSRSGIQFYFVVNELNESNKDLLKTYQLPEKSVLLTDKDFNLLNVLKSSTGLKSNNFPFIIFMLKNEIFYHSTGYNIGVGEQLLKIKAGFNN